MLFSKKSQVRILMSPYSAKLQNKRPKNSFWFTHRWGCAPKHNPESEAIIVDKCHKTVDKVYKLGRNLKKFDFLNWRVPPYMGLIPSRAGYIRGTFFLCFFFPQEYLFIPIRCTGTLWIKCAAIPPTYKVSTLWITQHLRWILQESYFTHISTPPTTVTIKINSLIMWIMFN